MALVLVVAPTAGPMVCLVPMVYLVLAVGPMAVPKADWVPTVYLGLAGPMAVPRAGWAPTVGLVPMVAWDPRAASAQGAGPRRNYFVWKAVPPLPQPLQ